LAASLASARSCWRVFLSSDTGVTPVEFCTSANFGRFRTSSPEGASCPNCRSRARIIGELQAYLDESGIHRGSRICAIADFVGQQQEWERIEQLWSQVPAREGITAFHMTEFESHLGPYARRQDPKGATMDNEKTCPKCPNSPKMNKLDRKSIAPDLTRLMLMRSNSGIYLQAFECPNCKLVEFYRIER
jgi:hypothetical protein